MRSEPLKYLQSQSGKELLTAQFVIINRVFPFLSFDVCDLINELWKKWQLLS